MNRQQRLITDFKSKYPSYYNLSDEDIWGKIGLDAASKGKKLYEFDPALSTDIKSTGDTEDADKKRYMIRRDTSPEAWDNLLTSHLATLFTKNGDPLGFGSAEYWQNVYNTSMAGTLYQAKAEKALYDVGDYDPGVIGHITSFFMSMGSPLDAYGFAKMGKVGHAGKVGAKNFYAGKGAVYNFAKKSIGRTAIDKAIKTKNPFYIQAITQGAQMTGSLAFYTGAHSALANAAEQSTQKGNINYWDVLKAGAKGTAEGAALGAVTGTVVGGAFKGGHLWAKSKLGQDPKFTGGLKAIEQIGIYGQIPAEAAAFTAMGAGLHGEPLTWESFATNLGVIGGIKLYSRLASGKTFEQQDVEEHVNFLVDREVGKTDAKIKSTENVVNSLKDKGASVPKELLKELEDAYIQREAIEADKAQLTADLAKKKELDTKGSDNWTGEDATWYGENVFNGGIGFTYKHFLQRYVKTSKDRYTADKKELEEYYDYQKKKGREITDKDKIIFEKSLEQQLERLVDIEAKINEAAVGGNQSEVSEKGNAQHIYDKADTSENIPSRKPKHEPLDTADQRNAFVKVLELETEPELVARLQGLEPGKSVESIREKYVDRQYDPAKGEWTGVVNKNLMIQDIIKQQEVANKGIIPKAVEESITPDEFDKMKHPGATSKQVERVKPIYKAAYEYLPKEYNNWSDIQKSSWLENRSMVLDDVMGFTNVHSRSLQSGTIKATTLKSYKDAYLKFAEHLSERGETLSKITKDQFHKAILESKVKNSAALNNMARFSGNKNIKDIDPGTVSNWVKSVDKKFRGADVDELPSGSHTNSIIPGEFEGTYIYHQQIPKTGNYKGVPISESLAKTIEALEGSNKNITKTRSEYIDPDGVPHEYVFYMQRGGNDVPLNVGMYNNMLKNIFTEAGFSKHTVGAIRKSFSTFLEQHHAGTEVNIAGIKKQILGHVSGTIGEKFYTALDPKLWGDYKRIQKDFIEMVFGEKEIPKAMEGPSHTKAYLSVSELNKIFETIGKSKKIKGDDYIHSNQTKIERSHLEAAFRKHVEIQARKNEVAVMQSELKEIIHPSTKDEALIKQVNKGKLKSDVPEAELTFENATEYKAWLSKELRKNPGLKIKTEIDAEYAGKFQDGIITVTIGKGGIKTFYHENAHRYKQMIHSTGNKRLINLWEKGERIFESDAKSRGYFDKYSRKEVANRMGIKVSELSQREYKKYVMEEYLADRIGEYGGKRETAKGLNKIGNWLKQIWSSAKQLFFGKEALNKKDIVRILGKDVWKGFESNRILKGEAKFSGFSGYNLEPEVRSLWNRVHKKVGLTNIKGQESIGEQLGLGSGWRIKDATFDDLMHFKEFLSGTEQGREVLKKDNIRRFKKIADIDSKRKDKSVNIGNAEQKEILEALGVYEGRIYNSTESQLNAYKSIIDNLWKGSDRTIIDYIDDKAILEALGDSETGKFLTRLNKYKPGLTSLAIPVDKLLKTLGHDKLAKKFATRSALEGSYNGSFRLMEEDIKRILKDPASTNKWEKGIIFEGGVKPFAGGPSKSVRDMMYLLDHEVYMERRGNNWLTDPEKKFIKKAFTKEWLNADEKIKMKHSEINRYVDLSTPEGKVVKRYIDFTKEFSTEFKEIMRETLGDARYEEFKDLNVVKWVEDNIYVARQLTKDAKRILTFDTAYGEKWKIEETEARARKKAQKENTDDWEQYKDAARSEVNSDWQNMMNFAPDKFSSNFVKPRHLKLPGRFKHNGKWVDMYETKWEQTSKRYAVGFSKLLANMALFPEIVKINGFKEGAFAGTGLENAIGKIKAVDPKWAHTIEKIVNQELGIDRVVSPSPFPGFLNAAASVLAKVGLSAPTSGIKNLILGTGQTLAAYRTKYVLEGMSDVMKNDFRREVVALGATDIGMREYRTFKAAKALDRLFQLGGMRPTENFNRYLAVATGRRDFLYHIENVTSFRPGSKGYKKSMDYLDKYYEMTKGEIEMLQKYGAKGFDAEAAIQASGKKFKSLTEQGAEQRKLNNIYKKAQFMTHVNTQGASLSLYMPMWASHQVAKPLTLFKRMAYAATRNTLRNTGLAIKNKQWGKVLLQGLIPFVSGHVMLGLWDALFNTSEMPNERTDGVEYLSTVLHRGEFLGILSEVVGLLGENGDRVNITPSIIDAGGNAAYAIYYIMSGEKTGGQSIEDFLKSTVNAYNFKHKIVEKGLLSGEGGEYKAVDTRMDKLYRAYGREVFPDIPEVEFGRNPNQKYYREFKNAFDAAFNDEGIDLAAKEFLISFHMLAGYYYKQGRSEDIVIRSWDEAYKQAFTTMKKRVKTFNPNQASVEGWGKMGDIKKRKTAGFWSWYEKKHGAKEAKQLMEEMNVQEKEYRIRLEKMFAKVGVYKEKLNIDYADFDSFEREVLKLR